GNFSFNSTLNNSGSSVAIPLDAFMLQATDNLTGLQSPSTLGNFQPGFVTTVQNVTFSNSGLVTGTVKRDNGDVVSFGTVDVTSPSLSQTVRVSIAQDGTYSIAGLAPGNYKLVATLPNSEGTPLTAAASATVVLDQTTVVDITFAPTGGVTGSVLRLSGDVVVNVPVQLHGHNP